MIRAFWAHYDLVVFGALVTALTVGAVPVEQAFQGFGHPATVVIALVLIISRGLSNASVVELVASRLVDGARALWLHVGVISGLAAVLSAMMNNVAALALLMPVDLRAARAAARSPARTLMPLSFASILGGMVTLIGTPPNIVIAAFRGETLGEPFTMFDFTPVGVVVAVVGVLFVTLIGRRLIPAARGRNDTSGELFELEDYVAELKVRDESPVIDKRLIELDEQMEEAGATMVGLIRDGRRLPGLARQVRLVASDVMVLQAGPETLEKLVRALGLDFIDDAQGPGALEAEDLELVEVVVPRGAAIEGRSALSMLLLQRTGVALLGVSREGRRFVERVRRLTVRAGDILLLLGPSDSIAEAVPRLGALPLANRGLQLIQRRKAVLAVVIFLAAILLASFGVIYLAGALAAVVVFYVLFAIVPTREIYESIKWPVIVLLGSMIPIGAALEASGGTAVVVQAIVDVTLGAAPWVVLTLLMVVTMSLFGRHEQHGDGGDRGADRHRRRRSVGRRSRSLPDGRCRLLRVPDADRSQEQHPDHGSRWLSLRRLLAHGSTARGCRRRRVHSHDPLGLALLSQIEHRPLSPALSRVGNVAVR